MIVGRGDELDLLDRLADAAARGEGSRLLVVGEPGIGKTALLDVARRRARQRGLRIVRAVAADGAEDQPFALLDDLFRSAGAGVENDAPHVSRRADTLLDALVALTDETPVLCVVDDAQFADPSSLAAVLVAVERGDDLPLLTIVATRPDPAVLERLGRWPRLDLPPLSTDAAVAVLRAAIGPDRECPVLVQLATSLRGNPLALTQAPRLLTEAQLAGRDPLPEPLPLAPALHRAWGGVIDGLPEGARTALLDLAVVGGRTELLAELAGPDTAAGIDEAARSGLVRLTQGEAPAFAHPLVRDVVLAHAPAAQRRARHRRVADAADRLGLPPAVVVGHLVRSTFGPDDVVAGAVAVQADRAEQGSDHSVAARAHEWAARLSLSASDRRDHVTQGIRLLARYGVAGDDPATLLDLVEGMDVDPETECEVAALRATRCGESDPRAGMAALKSVIDHARTDAPDLVGALLWELSDTAALLGDATASLSAARAFRELETLSRNGSVEHMQPWTGTALLAAALFNAGEVAAARSLRCAAIAAARGLDPYRAPLNALLETVFLDERLLDASPEADHRLLTVVERLRTEGEPLACMWGFRAFRGRARGDLVSASWYLAQGRPLAVATRALAPQTGMAALAVDLAAIRGDDDLLAREYAEAVRLVSHTQDRRRLVTVDRALGLRALVAGRLDDAISHLRAAADVPFLGRGLRDGVLPARVDLVEAFERRGDAAEAARRADAVHPLLAAMPDDPLAVALDARAHAIVVPDEAHAEASFAAALAVAPDPFEHGRTLLLHGEWCRRTRRTTTAREQLHAAARLFEHLGAAPWLRRARDELRAAGGTAASETATAAERDELLGLTPQEWRVARAVADGGTNREVATALYLSPRTVEYHLGSVYRKLGVHGRAALARRLVDAG